MPSSGSTSSARCVSRTTTGRTRCHRASGRSRSIMSTTTRTGRRRGWAAHGGVFLPMYQAEALWIDFHASYPMAVKLAAGKVDALTGDAWKNEISKRPQDYLVVPDQPWLDGFCVEEGMVRQFVAMPLGEGYTAEEHGPGSGASCAIILFFYALGFSDRLELQRGEVQSRGPSRSVEHLNAHHFVRFVVVEHDPWRDLLGLDYGGVVETQVEGVSFLVDVQLHVALRLVDGTDVPPTTTAWCV